MRSAALCVVVTTLVAATMSPRLVRAARSAATARPATRTQVKWLIHTGNLEDRWPPAASLTGRNGDAAAANGSARCPSSSATPNTISRLQMIDGGAVAVLVLPTGDGGHRCCRGGSTFSLGYVRLRHGFNNLYPIIRPFPDWRAFVDVPGPPAKSCRQRRAPAADDVPDDASECMVEEENSSKSAPPENGGSSRPNNRIVNAVDAFLDDLGRILWVLDTGDADEDACDSDTILSPPKFLAIDIHTNQTISVVSLSRMWKPGVSCFQYIVAVYPDSLGAEDEDDNATAAKRGRSAAWPLVVISDSGANRILVYSHCVDKFTEIALPQHNEQEDGNDDDEDDAAAGNRSSCSSPRPSGGPRPWPAPRVRDALYTIPLYPRPGHSALMVTYRSRPHVYKLRLQPSSTAAEAPGHDDASRVPPVPVTATLSTLGRKPCMMVMLGSDRRRTDRGDEYAGGGTTVYFRMADTNDLWSWDTKKCGMSVGLIDPRHFRLVRRGRTCRFPVAVSAAPVTGSGSGGTDDGAADESKAAGDVQQVVWMLETNAADHFAGNADRMGANAKLQPIEATSGHAGDSTAMRLKPSLRMRPSEGRRRNATMPRRNRCFPAR